jgi:hypothetical protein
LRAAAIAEEGKRTGPGGGFTATPDTLSDKNLNYLTLNYLRGLLAGNGVPADLTTALRGLIAAMPDIQVAQNMTNLIGERGTGYSLPDHKGVSLTVIIDDKNAYRGSPTEAVHHGIAPALGQPPSRMLD